mmetsp:Transcript_39007/g.62495  ORF Transcript_39007/g.62495 Transcript_39007/m.62495 type:complete len:125 (-) Transcript_39007:37-411(-)|eukprot:jgi/Bigna1/87835/estExt_fgenesh1_pg.C_240208
MLRSAINYLRPTINPLRRAMGTGGNYVPPREHRKVWMSDAGAYPIILIISGAATMATLASIRVFSQAPQLTWNKERRAMTIEEGTHEDTENVKKYYDHPLRRFGKARYEELRTHQKKTILGRHL